MTVEEKLKELILRQYRSVREFTQIIDMSYSTMDSILKRGVSNSSITNVTKICKALNISVDELADGKIVPVGYKFTDSHTSKVEDIVEEFKTKLRNYDELTINDTPATAPEIRNLCNVIDIALEALQRARNEKTKP